MPLRLKDLRNATRKIQVEFQDQTLEVEYYLNKATPALIAEMEGWSDKEALQRSICTLVKRWDLLDDDGNEIPLEFDVVSELPTEFLNTIQRVCLDDLRGGDAEKKV